MIFIICRPIDDRSHTCSIPLLDWIVGEMDIASVVDELDSVDGDADSVDGDADSVDGDLEADSTDVDVEFDAVVSDTEVGFVDSEVEVELVACVFVLSIFPSSLISVLVEGAEIISLF